MEVFDVKRMGKPENLSMKIRQPIAFKTVQAVWAAVHVQRRLGFGDAGFIFFCVSG